MTTVYPFIIRVGPVEITGFGLMMMVAFLVGGWIIDQDLRRRGYNPEYAADIVVAAVIGGIIGAKLWYVILTGDLGALFSRGGLVWYGGFLGGTLAVTISGWLKRVPFRWTTQLTAPALLAAHALGRLGCFMVGDDYGMPTTGWWGVKFPQGLPPTTAAGLAQFGVTVPPGTPPSAVLAVHPTQLYEAALLLVAFMVLWKLRTRPIGTGWLFGLYLIVAGGERFLIEFFRAKDDRFLGSFTIAQLTSVILVLIGTALVLRYRKAGMADPGEYLAGKGAVKSGKGGKGGGKGR